MDKTGVLQNPHIFHRGKDRVQNLLLTVGTSVIRIEAADTGKADGLMTVEYNGTGTFQMRRTGKILVQHTIDLVLFRFGDLQRHAADSVDNIGELIEIYRNKFSYIEIKNLIDGFHRQLGTAVGIGMVQLGLAVAFDGHFAVPQQRGHFHIAADDIHGEDHHGVTAAGIGIVPGIHAEKGDVRHTEAAALGDTQRCVVFRKRMGIEISRHIEPECAEYQQDHADHRKYRLVDAAFFTAGFRLFPWFGRFCPLLFPEDGIFHIETVVVIAVIAVIHPLFFPGDGANGAAFPAGGHIIENRFAFGHFGTARRGFRFRAAVNAAFLILFAVIVFFSVHKNIQSCFYCHYTILIFICKPLCINSS